MGIQSKSKNAFPFCGVQEMFGGFMGSTNVMIPGPLMMWIRDPNLIQDIQDCYDDDQHCMRSQRNLRVRDAC